VALAVPARNIQVLGAKSGKSDVNVLRKTDIPWLHKDAIKPIKNKISLGEVFLNMGKKI